MGARILFVEDDEAIRASLRLVLEDEGLHVDEAATAEDALEAIPSARPDVLVVDVMLPGMGGFELTRQVRRASNVPIIIVTARADSHDIVAGLEAGADDYMVKPVVPKELTARIRAVLRRVNRDTLPGKRAMHVAGVEVDLEGATVTKHGRPVPVTRTEFRLLCELLAHRGRVLSREALLSRVWGYDYFGDGRLVDVHVHRLRTKIEDDAANPAHLLTVRGLGYKLVE